MPYDTHVAERLRKAVGRIELAEDEALSERNMFGGLSILLNGKMLGGVAGRELVVRLADDELEQALDLPYVRHMDFTGKPMKNFAYIRPDDLESDSEIDAWILRSLAFVRAQPQTKSPPKRKRASP